MSTWDTSQSVQYWSATTRRHSGTSLPGLFWKWLLNERRVSVSIESVTQVLQVTQVLLVISNERNEVYYECDIKK